ncbi:MAG: 6-phosphogluconolactonase, partial [Bacteroidetes bacterium]|nr:6-phosphogluconolactonase [Bacteroidota bacterium]
MELHLFDNADELANDSARWIADCISQTLKTQDRYTLVLSGGSTPKKLHTILAASPYKEQIDWSKLHIFWGDERAVPFDDVRNNAKMAFDTLLDKVPVPRNQIHIMDTKLDPESAATEYERVLRRYFDEEGATFDLVLLGMGDDGHTLSLFPGKPIIHEEKKWAAAYYLKEQNMFRITLTAPIVNRAHKVAFLVTGA